MVKQTRSIKGKKSDTNKIETEDYSKYSSYSKLKTKQSIDEHSQKKFGVIGMFNWSIIFSGFFIILLITGIFSPNSNPGNNEFVQNEDLPENTFTQASGQKLSVVLYSSPTCGCCHNYVAYLEDNNFDVFQKRTEAYQDIKDELLIPEDVRACHTVIIGDYFTEGHIPLSVIYKLLDTNPDIDGITLPGMPTGSPGMGGNKDGDWVVFSILNGDVLDVFETV